MPSFDVASEVEMVEVRNALDQANKEIANRFDFKGTGARVELNGQAAILFADNEFQLDQVKDLFFQKLSKRSVDVRNFSPEGDIQKISGGKVKMTLAIQVGVTQEIAKRVVKCIKDNKALKLQATIQGDVVRVSGAKKDALQQAIALLRENFEDVPLQYQNFRD